MEAVLTCTGLCKSYRLFLPALNDLTFSLYRGRIIGLHGPSGSGKTTFMKLAAGLITPSDGELSICGMPVSKRTKRIVSYLPDRNFLPDYMRVSELVKLFADFYPDFDTARAYDMLDALNIDLRKNLCTLPEGMCEKVRLSLVMSRRAKLYLLDEPFSAVDPAARTSILETVLANFDRESTLLISTQQISDVEPILDDVLLLQHGTVRLYDSAENVRSAADKSLDEYFREVFRC